MEHRVSVIFLGTGPANGIQGTKRDRRRESSIILRVDKCDYLFDVTNDFGWQKNFLRNLKGVFITHGHNDAIGGIGGLSIWHKDQRLKNPIPLYTHPRTIFHIKKAFSDVNYLEFKRIIPNQAVEIGRCLEIIPISVPHSI